MVNIGNTKDKKMEDIRTTHKKGRRCPSSFPKAEEIRGKKNTTSEACS